MSASTLPSPHPALPHPATPPVSIPSSITTKIAIFALPSIAAHTLILMEACRTIPCEWRMCRRALKRGRLNAAEILFLAIKYFAIVAYSLDAVIKWTTLPHSGKECGAISWASHAFMHSCISLVALAVAWRAHIIFHRSKISLIILSLALAGQIAVNATSMGRQLKWSVYREGYCNINPRKWTRQSYHARPWYMFITPWNVFYNAMFDLAIAVATSYRLIKTTRGLNGLTRISKLLFYNNVHYVLIVCSANLFDFVVTATGRDKWPTFLITVFALQICAVLDMLSSEQDAVHSGGNSLPRMVRAPPSGAFGKGSHSTGSGTAVAGGAAIESDENRRRKGRGGLLRKPFDFFTTVKAKYNRGSRNRAGSTNAATGDAERTFLSKDAISPDDTLESVPIVPTLLHSSPSRGKVVPNFHGFKVESETLVDGYQSPIIKPSPMSSDTLCDEEQKQHHSWHSPTSSGCPSKGDATFVMEHVHRHHPQDLDLVAVGSPEDGVVYYTYNDETSPRDLEQATFLRSTALQSSKESPSKGLSIREIRQQLQQQCANNDKDLEKAVESRRRDFEQELAYVSPPPCPEENHENLPSPPYPMRPSTSSPSIEKAHEESPKFEISPGKFQRKPKTSPTSSSPSSASSSPSKKPTTPGAQGSLFYKHTESWQRQADEIQQPPRSQSNTTIDAPSYSCTSSLASRPTSSSSAPSKVSATSPLLTSKETTRKQHTKGTDEKGPQSS